MPWFPVTQIFTLYRGPANPRKRRDGDSEHIGSAELEPAEMNLVFGQLADDQIGTDKEPVRVRDREDRERLLGAAERATRQKGEQIAQAFAVEIGRPSVPDWALGELDRRVSEDPSFQALSRFESLIRRSVQDLSLHLVWDED